jgi:hypothetical protein
MDPQLLIHNIVRQTTVLIAQISTAAGLRAPLSHVANQVFLDLARELESQGVRRNVVADMFGLALRSYQLKFQRALEAALGQRTLWREVYETLGKGASTRSSLETRFARVDPKTLSAVLHDLVESGIAYSSGRGPNAAYGLVPHADRERIESEDSELLLAQFVWLHLSTQGRAAPATLSEVLNVPLEEVQSCLAYLVTAGKVKKEDDHYEALTFDIPVGASHGWEAAVCDHFRAVSNAIAAKVESPRSRSDDRIGGTTFKFTVYEGHPSAERVFGLLARFREELNELWEATSAHNAAHPIPEDATRVTFYFGQNLTSDGLASEGEAPQN